MGASCWGFSWMQKAGVALSLVQRSLMSLERWNLSSLPFWECWHFEVFVTWSFFFRNLKAECFPSCVLPCGKHRVTCRNGGYLDKILVGLHLKCHNYQNNAAAGLALKWRHFVFLQNSFFPSIAEGLQCELYVFGFLLFLTSVTAPVFFTVFKGILHSANKYRLDCLKCINKSNSHG